MNYTYNPDELYHYGVLGMKWGQHKAIRKAKANARLEKKSLQYDIKSAKASKKSEKYHAENDLERSNNAAIKTAKYAKKSAALQRKAVKTENLNRQYRLEAQAGKYAYKSTKAQIDGDRLSKTAAYGRDAMRWSIKSDKFAKKAAKARYEIAKNNKYINMVKQRYGDIPDIYKKNGSAFVKSKSKPTTDNNTQTHSDQ